jgi:hypothetical protein
VEHLESQEQTYGFCLRRIQSFNSSILTASSKLKGVKSQNSLQFGDSQFATDGEAVLQSCDCLPSRHGMMLWRLITSWLVIQLSGYKELPRSPIGDLALHLPFPPLLLAFSLINTCSSETHPEFREPTIFIMYDYVDLTDGDNPQQDLVQQDNAEQSTSKQESAGQDTAEQHAAEQNTAEQNTAEQNAVEQNVNPSYRHPSIQKELRIIRREVVKLQFYLSDFSVEEHGHLRRSSMLLDEVKGLLKKYLPEVAAQAEANMHPTNSEAAQTGPNSASPVSNTFNASKFTAIIPNEAPTQTGPDLTSPVSNTSNMGTVTTINANEAPAQTEEENEHHQKRKRRGRPRGSAAKRVRT